MSLKIETRQQSHRDLFLFKDFQSKEVTPYESLAHGIAWLHENSDPVQKLSFRGEVVKMPNKEVHGFTSYEIDWASTLLPPRVRDFLMEGSKANRVNIFTNIFSVTRTDRFGEFNQVTQAQFAHKWRSDEEYRKGWQEAYPEESLDAIIEIIKTKVEEGEIILESEPIGEDQFYTLTLSTPRRQLEIEVKRGYYFNFLLDLLNPGFSLTGRFLPIGGNGMITQHDDPRNFQSVDQKWPPSDQLFLATKVLQFAVAERQRQLQR